MVKVGIGGGPFLVWVTQVLTSGVEEGFDQGVGVVNTWGDQDGMLDPDGTSPYRETRDRGYRFLQPNL